jgi:hypothetical protein
MKTTLFAAIPLATVLAFASTGIQRRRSGRRHGQGRLHRLPQQGQEDRRPELQADRRKAQGQDDVAKLMEKVRKGGSGVFGPVPMAPNPPDKISDADLKAAVEFILKR